MACALSVCTICALRGANRRGVASSDASAVWRAFRTAEEVRARSLGDELALGADRCVRPVRSAGRGAARPADIPAVAPGRTNPAPGSRGGNGSRCVIPSRRHVRSSTPSASGRRSRRPTDFTSRIIGAGPASATAGNGGARVFVGDKARTPGGLRAASCVMSLCPAGPAATSHRRSVTARGGRAPGAPLGRCC